MSNAKLRAMKDLYVSRLKTKEEQKVGNILFRVVDIPFTRLDKYLHKSMYELPQVPMLWIDGVITMSLTDMELESHLNVIEQAKGKVGVAGLGLGFYVQMIADKEEVTQIDVYEINENVIELYGRLFDKNPKINIIKKDARSLGNEKYDVFYCDIYTNMPDKETALEDYALLTENNEIKEYYYWTFEKHIIDGDMDWEDDVPVKWFDLAEELGNKLI